MRNIRAKYDSPEKILEFWMEEARFALSEDERIQGIGLLKYFHRQVRCHEDLRDRRHNLIRNWRRLEDMMLASQLWSLVNEENRSRILDRLDLSRFHASTTTNPIPMTPEKFFSDLLTQLKPHQRISHQEVTMARLALRYLKAEAGRAPQLRDQSAIKHSWAVLHPILEKLELMSAYRSRDQMRQALIAFIRG